MFVRRVGGTNILRGRVRGEEGRAHRGRVNALYFYFYRYVGWGGDSWVWRVEIGSKVGGSAENFGHIGDRTHAKNLLRRLGVR